MVSVWRNNLLRVWVSIFHVQLDILHLMDLGVCQHFGGSVFYLFFLDCGLRGSFEERADVVWPALLNIYVEFNTPPDERLSEALFTRAVSVHESPRSISNSSARPLWQDSANLAIHAGLA